MKNLLFICIENSNRSQIAEAYGHIYADNRVGIYSAGSKPIGKINPRAIKFMHEVGYELGNQSSKSVDELHSVEFEYVISMGCGDECPIIQAKFHEDWQIPDPKNMSDDDYRTIRNYIGIKVRELIERVLQLEN